MLLKKAGCVKSKIFVDKISGTKTERPGLDACLAELNNGDTLIVWPLDDRLGRSMHHLVLLVEELRQKGIGFKSICDGSIDTTTASGELIFNIFSSLAQFERRLIKERTKAGLDTARSRGKKGGRKKIKSTNPKVLMAKKMHIEQARRYATIDNRSIPKQIEHWSQIGKIAEDNPDLPYGFIKDILFALDETYHGEIEEYSFDSK